MELVKGASPTNDEARAKITMAGICLADEPNIDNNVVESVINALIKCMRDGDGWSNKPTTAVDKAFMAIANSDWRDKLLQMLFSEYLKCFDEDAYNLGSIIRMIDSDNWVKLVDENKSWKQILVNDLKADNLLVNLLACLRILYADSKNNFHKNSKLLKGLFDLLQSPVSPSASRCLRDILEKLSRPFSKAELNKMLTVILDKSANKYTVYNLVRILGTSARSYSIPIILEALTTRLQDDNEMVRVGSALALSQMGVKYPQSCEPLVEGILSQTWNLADKGMFSEALAYSWDNSIITRYLEIVHAENEIIRNYAIPALMVNAKIMPSDIVDTLLNHADPYIRESTQFAISHQQSENAIHISFPLEYATILVVILCKGNRPKGIVPAYFYVALHLDEFNMMMAGLTATGYTNPANYNATILARYTGEPSDEVQAFMRRKFGYCDKDHVVIQRERTNQDEEEARKQEIKVYDRFLSKAIQFTPYLDKELDNLKQSQSNIPDNENDYPLHSINYMRIGGGYIHPGKDYQLRVKIFEAYVKHVNQRFDPGCIDELIFEEINE